MIFIKRKLIILVICFFVVLSTIAISSIFLLKSQSFNKFIVTKVAKLSDGELLFDGFKGNILNGLEITSLNYKNHHSQISIGKVKLDLDVLAFIAGRLHIRSLTMQGVELRSKVSAATITQDAIFLLKNRKYHFKVILENLGLEDLVVHSDDDQQYHVDKIFLKLFVDEDVLHITQFILEEKNVYANLTSDVVLDLPYPFQVEARYHLLKSENENFKGKLDVKGDVHSMEIKHQLYAPLYSQLIGEIELNPLGANRMQLAFAGDLNGQDLPSMSIQASGKGTLQDFELDTFTTKSLGGVVNGNGYINWKSPHQWYFTIKGMDINPGNHWALWPGKIDFTAKARGEIDSEGPVVELDEISVVGDLLNQPFRMSGGVKIDSKEIKTEEITMVSGKNHLLLNGTASLHSNLQVEFDFPEPEKLWTGINGHFRGDGKVTGDIQKPTGTIAFDGTDLRYGDYTFQKVDGLIGIDLNDMAQSKAHFQVQNVQVADIYFSESTLDFEGDFQDHQINLNIISPSTNLTLGFDGSCRKDNCEFVVDNASFDLQPYGNWQLFNPVQLLIKPGSIKPFDSCWVQDDFKKCLRSSWSALNGWKSVGDVDAPVLVSMLDILKEFLNKDHLGWNKKSNH